MPGSLAPVILSGSLVGLVLGALGSGGSILALPLLVYVVGYEGDPHVAIGTTALAVAASAFLTLLQHRRRANVDLRAGLLVAAPGVLGALLGAQLGLATDGSRLLFLFSLVLLAAAYAMARGPPRRAAGDGPAHVGVVLGAGLLVGALSGYFGIGGGFLVVPALVFAARLDTRSAIGTSLVAVTAFGLTTAARYAVAGSIDLPVAGLFILGGAFGGIVGTVLHHRTDQARLRRVFAATLVLVAVYMLLKTSILPR